MDRFDPFVKYADVYGDIINWEKDPMNKPQNQNKYFFSDGKTYYEQICKMLRLMSVFKEAFNQIYSNEDEISEAWENFVNNLSASVVEGSEPDVTLTWTDDSVNFEFTMVPGVPGEQGVGITSISFNSDYTMTITLSDGNTYTSMSLKGETGPQGPQGETGSGLQILDVYATLADLQSAHPTGQPGDAYQVGSAGNYILYIWSSSQSAWVQAGTLGTVSPYTSAPLMDGTASAGSQNLYARGDHVHPSDTSRASKEELDALIKTSQALIDQSFTYRKSPAIQDGLARIDKIKGNTLVWNQLVPSFTGSSDAGMTWSYDNGLISVSGTATNSFSRKAVEIIIDTAHKYALLSSADQSATPRFSLSSFSAGGAESSKRFGQIAQFDQSGGVVQIRLTSMTIGETYNKSAYLMVIDLTKMFGAGNEPATLEEFTSLFSLPYYDYNVGSLLSFNGTGLKVTSKNLFNARTTFTTNGITFTNDNGIITINGTSTATAYFTTDVNLRNGSYFISSFNEEINTGVHLAIRNESGAYPLDMAMSAKNRVASLNNDIQRLLIYVNSGTTLNNFVMKPMVSFETSEYFEPYAENTINLPILNYFPNGMRSAGNAHDEITSNKAITRMGSITFNGTQNYVEAYLNDSQCQALYSVPDIMPIRIASSVVDNGIISNYLMQSSNEQTYNGIAGIHRRVNGVAQIMVSLGTASGITTSEAWNAYLSAHPLTVYYPLATPTETAVDLDLDFMAYENGTEQVLPVNGSAPSTSPIIADMTYLSIDDAMEYIIDKLSNVPQNTQQILESLEDDVSDLQTDVGTLQTNVSGLQTSVGNINTNIGQLSSTVAGHTASISDMQSDITDLNTGLSDLEDTVTDNTSRIGTLETDLASTDGQVQSIGSSVSTLSSTVSDQGTELGEIESIIQDISNNPVISALGSHELGFVAAYVNATLPANTGTRVTIPKPTIFPNNYTPLFIVGMSTGAYNVSICDLPPTFGNSDSVNCRVWNHGSQQTTQITVYILCMRQRQSQ